MYRVDILVEAANTREDRLENYSRGEEEYICLLNKNDIPAPGALQALVNALEHNKKAVAAYGRLSNTRIRPDLRPWSFKKTLEEPTYLQGLIVYRRSALNECLHWVLGEPVYFDWVLRACVAMQGEFILVPEATCLKANVITWNEAPKMLKDVIDVYTSCSTCRNRLGLDKKIVVKSRIEKEELERSAAPVTRKCCGRL